MNTAVREFLDHLPLADDLAIAHLAKFRTEPPASSALDAATYQRLFGKALDDAYAALQHYPGSPALYVLLDDSATALQDRISASDILESALLESGAFAAEGSVRAFVLACVLRESAPESLSEFAAAILKLPVLAAIDLEPDLAAPSFG